MYFILSKTACSLVFLGLVELLDSGALLSDLQLRCHLVTAIVYNNHGDFDLHQSCSASWHNDLCGEFCRHD